MEKLVKQRDNSVVTSLQPSCGSVEALFQVAELFPIPIQVFTPDGDTVFANRAVLEMWNIADSAQIVGRYNLLKDPVVNERLGLSDYVQRIFAGEIMVVPDVKVPLEDFARWYQAKNTRFGVEAMYTDILNFPIRNERAEIAYIVSVFISTRMYPEKADVAKARACIEAHWQDEFDLDNIAAFVHMSKYHLARMFKKHVGMTPFGYYQDVKINRIKQALRDANHSVSDAFAACGVTYSGNMTRLFKQKTGMTPTQYRKSLRA